MLQSLYVIQFRNANLDGFFKNWHNWDSLGSFSSIEDAISKLETYTKYLTLKDNIWSGNYKYDLNILYNFRLFDLNNNLPILSPSPWAIGLKDLIENE